MGGARLALIARAWAWLHGRDLGPETHRHTRRIFLTLLGVVYLAAFASLAAQVQGLLGSGGISPAAPALDSAAADLGLSRLWRAPTLLWLWRSDTALQAFCVAGIVGSLLFAAGVAPRLLAALLWLLYLSFVSAGGIFLRYQWDALLLETGFLAIWLAPARLSPRRAAEAPVDPLAVWLLRLLLFKLMFLSGVVKLASGDPTWRELSAMEFHYWTQPLPSPTSWLAHHLPPAIHHAEVVGTFAVELAVPFLIFAPRRLRWLAWPPLAGLQLLISATGNYGFFNLLTFALCVLLLDDAALARLVPRRFRLAPPDPAKARRTGRGPARVALAVLAAGVLVLNLQLVLDRLGLALWRPAAVLAAQRGLRPFHVANAYGLFAVMTTDRNEIALEGSRDGETWRPYRFRWKPGPPDRAPRFAGLHMPRLDWQLWFASLRGCRQAVWFHAFLRRVLEGVGDVLDLVAENPFPDAPPRYLRTPFARYTFAPPGADAWWEAAPVGSFCPMVTLRGDRLVAVRPGGA